MPPFYIFLLSVAVSLVYFAVTVVTIIRMSPDYFTKHRISKPLRKQHFLVWLLAKLVKNAIGAGLVLIGFILIFLPGQGVLTILLGLLFLDFPGKRTLERRLVKTPSILHTLNWVRAKAGKPPLLI